MTLNKLLGIILFLYLPFSSLAAQQQYAHAPIPINQSINKAFDLPYERLNHLDSTILYLNQAKQEGLTSREAETSKLFADLLKKQNNDKEALLYLERYLALKDSLFNVESTKKIAQLEANYQFEKEKQALIYQNEVENKILDNEIQRQRTWQIVLGLALIFSLLALFFYSRYQRLNTKINTQRLQFEQKERERLAELVIPNKPITEISTISKSDLLWLEEVEDLLKKEMPNSNFHFDQLANQLFISRSQLQRRIKKITGLTPNKYFREIRLQSARNLLESGEVRTISETAYAVGFDTPKYFSKIYQERFGKHPKTYF